MPTEEIMDCYQFGKIDINNLIFHNPLTTPVNIAVKTDAESVPLIMEWYASHHAGDKYMVTFKGRDIPMDINGCPIKDII